MCVNIFKIRLLLILVVAALAASCSNTQIINSWTEPGQKSGYARPMIIGISDSQQTRRIYENQFVAELQKFEVEAVPSYRLISSKVKMDKETVLAAIAGSDIDSVIITYLISDDEEVANTTSVLDTDYIGNIENNQVSSTIISTRGRGSSAEIVTLKNDFYDAASHTLVWTVQTRTKAPESIDEVVTDVTELLVKKLIDDQMFR
jgi:hypothetical protein